MTGQKEESLNRLTDECLYRAKGDIHVAANLLLNDVWKAQDGFLRTVAHQGCLDRCRARRKTTTRDPLWQVYEGGTPGSKVGSARVRKGIAYGYVLSCGVRLQDATYQQVEAEMEMYYGQAKPLQRRGDLFKSVLDRMHPRSKKVVGDYLTETEITNFVLKVRAA